MMFVLFLCGCCLLFVLVLFVVVFVFVVLVMVVLVKIQVLLVIDVVVKVIICDVNNVKCDGFCYLVQMLLFFKVMLEKIVIEIMFGNGWYLEILVLLLYDKGYYVVVVVDLMVVFEGCGCDYQQCSCDSLEKKYVGVFVQFGKIVVVVYDLVKLVFGLVNLVDVVLIFCNVYNWCKVGQVQGMFQGFFNVFKLGGVLGVVEYCVKVDVVDDDDIGYVGQQQVIVMVEVVGFKLDVCSEVNVNLCDIKDYFNGVWMLLLINQYDKVDDVKYQVIGESDCMILCFIKL